MTNNVAKIKSRITSIDTTDENLAGRAGLIFISRYPRAAGISDNFHLTHFD